VTDARLEAQVVDQLDDLGPVEGEWRALAELRSNAFLTPEWFRAWWGNYGERLGFEPAVVVARRPNGDLAGVVPLAFETGGLLRPARFAGAGLGDWFHPAAALEDELEVGAAAIRALDDRKPRWKALILERVPAGGGLPEAMIGSSPRRLAAIRRSPVSLPYLDLRGLTGGSYLEQSTPRFRKRIRYLERSLGQNHEVRVRDANDPDLISADLDAFYGIHLRRWEGKGDSSIATPSAMGMLREFATAALARGWLRLRFLEVDGEAVATFLGWRIGERYCFYQGGFEGAWAKHSVGLMLVARSLRAAVEEGASEFDMLQGDEAYKARFSDRAREAVTVTLVPVAHPARVALSGEALARRLGRRAAQGRAGGLLRAVEARLPTSNSS
jgi:CelD/BcsL family acetyltransferase involved in cellulose biosynthesis